MNVSIIIVNYNTKDLLVNCIKSIYLQTNNLEFEIIVVDNASIDGSQKYIRETYPDVILIESEINLGFGGANNLGVKKAKGKYLFFLNSDTILVNNAIKILFDFFESKLNTNIAVVGSLLLDETLKPIHSSGSFPSKFKALKGIFLRYVNKKYLFNSDEKLMFNQDVYFEVDYVTGADLFITKSLFESIGGFDSDFFMYYEDTDLQKRLNNFDFKSIILDGPKIIHLEGGSNSTPNFSVKRRIMVTKSMFLYFKKHSNLTNYLVYRFFYFFIRLPVLFDSRISFGEKVKYFSFLKGKV